MLDVPRGQQREHGHTRLRWSTLPVGARHPLGTLARAERSERDAPVRDQQAVDTHEDQEILVRLSEGTRKEVTHLAEKGAPTVPSSEELTKRRENSSLVS